MCFNGFAERVPVQREKL